MELTKNLTQAKLFKSLVVIVLGSIALTISAKIKIPFYPVPMTMQTFVVLFLGISLGHKIALATIGLYLIEGIAGLPVFSNSPEKGVGLVYFTGPTMGYLIGFLVTVYLSGKFNYDNNFNLINIIKNFLKLLLATSFIYILGMIWLGNLIGWEKPIFQLGAQPFLIAELFKILIATFAINQIKKIKKLI